MKPSNMHNTSHRVTHTRMIARQKVPATVAKTEIQNRFTKPWGRTILPALENPAGKKANWGDSRKAYVAAAGFGGLALLGTACSKFDILEEHTNNQTYMMVAEKNSYEKVMDSIDLFSLGSIVLAGIAFRFAVKGIYNKRKVPGIIGSSGLVPIEKSLRAGELNANVFREEGISDEEFARVQKESNRFTRAKNRTERYRTWENVETGVRTLMPNDFKYRPDWNIVGWIGSVALSSAAALASGVNGLILAPFAALFVLPSAVLLVKTLKERSQKKKAANSANVSKKGPGQEKDA